MAKSSQRRFGTIRKLPSGRYQVRYWGPDGVRRPADQTFATRTEAGRYLTLLEAQISRSEWIDPEAGKVTLAVYSGRWITERPGLRPRTVHLYRWILTKHVNPALGGVALNKLTTPMIRSWRVNLMSSGVSENGAAKAYRLLRAILNTAVREDEILRANPCRIPGADQEHPAERPTLTVPQVLALADKMPTRFKALILVTTFGCLRWGEVTALQRADINIGAQTVRIRHAFTEQRGKGLVIGPPKSRAGLRTVALPKAIIPAMDDHLAKYVGAAANALVFTTESGKPILRGNFNKMTQWSESAAAVGMPGLHFHDLRHTGNTLASNTGTSLRDLMARMGHDSPRAAMIYQHATDGADRAIAAGLDLTLNPPADDSGHVVGTDG